MSEAQEKNTELEEIVEVHEPTSFLTLAENEVITNPERNSKYIIKRKLSSLKWRIHYNIYEIKTYEIEQDSELNKEATLDDNKVEDTDQSSPQLISENVVEDFSSVFWLWEANTDEAKSLLEKEIKILESVEDSRFPKIIEHFSSGNNFYLVTEKLPEKTLAEALSNKEINLPDFLTIVAQIAHGLSNLHEKGFVHLGLKPECILLDKPIKIVDFRWTMQIGDRVQNPFFHPGFSPPELAKKDEVIDQRADIFSIGALLYYFLEGKQIPETGFSFLDFKCTIGGVPQILNKCLCSKEERFADVKSLHREILKLKRMHSPTIQYEVLGATDIGLEPTRTTNQDAYAYIEINAKSDETSFKSLFACIADGMGGMEAGELASDVAIKSVISGLTSTILKSTPASEQEQYDMLKQLIISANESVCSALEKKGVKGGTTLLCCYIIGDRVVAANVGDCRLYLLRGDSLTLLTRDHSLAYFMASQEGNIDLNELRKNPDRSRLLRSLGSNSRLPDYHIDSLEVTTNRLSLELLDEDILILCSDGLWEPVTEEDMVSIIRGSNFELQTSISKLLRCALDRGAPDNITVILIKIKKIITH